MNDPVNVEINIKELREWLARHQLDNSLSLKALARDSAIGMSTISAWLRGTYTGNEENVARAVFSYQQKVRSQEARAATALARPHFIETKSGDGLLYLMEWAQGGRITVAATGPGVGKTMAAEHYKASMGETVWLATMKKTTKSVTAMIAQVMKAMGLVNASGWAQQRSGQVEAFVQGKRGLLIVDEANHLELDSFEEIRAWHDATGLGVCFLGNEELLERIRGGAHRHAYARLNSRIAIFHVQDLPYAEDVAAYSDALEIDDLAIRKVLTDIARSPGHGGLREVQQILETAHQLTIAREQILGIDHVREAIASRTIDARRRAA